MNRKIQLLNLLLSCLLGEGLLDRINLKILGVIVLATVFFPAPMVTKAFAVSENTKEFVGSSLDYGEYLVKKGIGFVLDNTINQDADVKIDGDNNEVNINQDTDLKQRANIEDLTLQDDDNEKTKIRTTQSSTGNLKVIAEIDPANQKWCGLEFKVSFRDAGFQKVASGVKACNESVTFEGVPLSVGDTVRICAYGTDNDLSGCETVTNSEKNEPERVSINVS